MRKEDPPSSVSVLSSEVPKLESDRIPTLDDVITLDLGRIMLAVREPTRRKRGKVCLAAEDFLGTGEFLELDKKAMGTDIGVQRILPLGLRNLRLVQKCVGKRRHTEITERLCQGAAAKSAIANRHAITACTAQSVPGSRLAGRYHRAGSPHTIPRSIPRPC